MDTEKLARLRVERQKPASVVSPVRRRVWRYSLMVLSVVVFGLAALWLYRTGALTPAVSVRTASVTWVYPSQIYTELNASGYVVAQRQAEVASKGTGRLAYLGVEEGSYVRKGDVLAQLENDDLVAERAQTEAQLNSAKARLVEAKTEEQTAERDWVRYKNLVGKGVVSRTSYDAAEDRYYKARAAIRVAEANIKALEAALERQNVLIEYTYIRAPFDGVVLTKNAEVGEVVAPFGSAATAKAAVVTMADLSSRMVEADVAEAFLPRVRVGQPCEIQLDGLPEERFPGRVDTIVPTADRTRGTVLVKVRFDQLDPRILPEMSARVVFLSKPLSDEERKPFLGIHKDALRDGEGDKGVFKLESERVRWIPVPEPRLFGDYILVDTFLREGEQVVLNPSPKLKDGSKIKLAE